MKKVVALLMAACCAFAFTPAVSGTALAAEEEKAAVVEETKAADAAEAAKTAEENATTAEAETAEAEKEEAKDTAADEKSEGVMTYAQYLAAELEDEVVIEAYVQAKQSWWDNKATVYTQDADGAYFLYNMACSEEDYAKLLPGTKIKVTGYKSEWSGEVEIVDATFEILEGEYIAKPVDVTDLLGMDELVEFQNQLVSFTGMTVEAIGEKGEAFLYNWDGSGTDGNDLYFKVSKDGASYTFTVESYLCDKSTDVYAAVKELKVGDVIDMEGFLYWYEGVNPHITKVAPHVDINAKSEGVMTYAEYLAAELEDEVVIEAYVQAKQSWWDNKATVYTQDGDGAYFLYNMACSEEDYAKLVPGTKIKVTGFKSEWSGEVEIVDASFEILEGHYVARPEDVTALLGTDALVKKQNRKVSFKGMTVEAIGEKGETFLYNWDGSGTDGNDLYFKVGKAGASYTFTVESYLCDKTTDVYAAVKELKVGDVVDLEGFLYWYEGVNPHITAVAEHKEKDAKSEGVMTYDEYLAAELEDEVVIEAYVQAKQSWWDNKATVYTQDADGAYFLYNMACSEEDYAKLVPGTKIKVTGFKSEWSGEVEIVDASFEILEGHYVARPEDVTALLGTDALVKKQNRKVSFKGMTVEAIGEKGETFLYNWDGSGTDGNDLYFKVSKDGETYTFTVESYLCDNTTDVYAAVKALEVGQTVDLTGYLYWYEGVNPHITSVKVVEQKAAETNVADGGRIMMIP